MPIAASGKRDSPDDAELRMLRRTASIVRAGLTATWAHRNVIRELTRREVQIRFAGSMLGLGWMLLQPLASLAVYALVFGGILKLGRNVPGGNMGFVTGLFAGLIVYNAFAEPVSRASRLVVSRPNYVTKVVFPLEVLPLPIIAATALQSAVSTLVLLAMHVAFVGPIGPAVLAIPLVLALVLLLSLGCSWVLASVGVFVRDVHDAVRIVMQLLFYLSPVVWTTSMLENPSSRSLALLNPLAIAIDVARSGLGSSAGPGLGRIVALAVVALLVALCGHSFFRKTRPGFADVL